MRIFLSQEHRPTSSFASDVIKLVGGTTVSQILVILSAPIITRMYGPEAFGLSALFASLAGIIGVIACLRYEMAIMLPEKDEDAANLLALSLFLAVLVSGISAIVIWLNEDTLMNLLNAQALENFLWLVPISVLLSGIFLALNYWNSRIKCFGRLSIARVTASVATTGTQLGAGFSGYATGGSLIVASLLGSAISTILLGWQIWKDDGRKLIKSFSAKDIKVALKRYRKFPLFDTWSALLNSGSWQLPIFLLSTFFSPAVVGYYALGMMVLQLPTSLIGSAISQVFFQRGAEAKFDGSLSEVVEEIFLKLVVIGALPVVLLSITGEDIFVVIFGATWAEAGVYAQILAIWMFFVFVTSPISTVFSIFEKQGSFLVFNILLFGTRAAALIFGGYLGDARFTLILFSVVGAIDYAGMGLWILHEVGIPVSHILKVSGRPVAYIIFILFIVVLAKWILLLSPQKILLLDILLAILYYLSLSKSQYHLFSRFKSII